MESKLEGRIFASPKYDPGCRDIFNNHKDKLKEKCNEKMDNVNVIPNDKGLVVSKDPVNYPATDHLLEVSCFYKISDQKRNFCLIVEDMEYGYESYIKYCIPEVKKLVDQFRAMNLPIVWTNWARRHDDGMYGGLDRFYGPQGIKDELNPCYIYGENGINTVNEIAPQTEDEVSRSIVSIHLSKFADYDENGREILFPMLEAWGVDTIIMCGAWTDDCLATTIFDAVDKYGYDMIVIEDGCATATANGDNMMKVLYASTSCRMTADQLVEYLKNNPDKVEAPKAPLNGNVRHTYTKYRHDPILQEVETLRKRVAELEAKIMN